MGIKGRVHSIETCGTVDGPGIRYVIFLQGCPLRCQYCHNPDTWDPTKGIEHDSETIMKDIIKYKSYMKFSGGGVTISGGDPLLQMDFIMDIIKKCKKEGIHVALDTSGFLTSNKVDALLESVDLVLLDIKHFDKAQYHIITGGQLDNTLTFLEKCKSKAVETHIRYVLVPNLSDQLDSIESLAKFLSQYDNVSKIEVLPFHKMGEYKWTSLSIPYRLSDTQEPTELLLNQVQDIFRRYNPDKL